MPQQKKVIKAWFVDMPSFGNDWKRYFSGEGLRNQARIYPTKEAAEKIWPHEKPIPVLISFPKPTKSKKK